MHYYITEEESISYEKNFIPTIYFQLKLRDILYFKYIYQNKN